MGTASPSSPEPTRLTVLFSGRVQGVGFRYTTRHVAARFQVTGFVRNLGDGRVEMVAEGARPELDRFQRAIEEAMPGHIAETRVRRCAATGEYADFHIAF